MQPNLKTIIKRVIKRLLFKNFAARSIQSKIWSNRFKKVAHHHKEIEIQLRTESKIRVLFIVVFDSIWKYESVYRLMEKDSRYEPIILVSPYFGVDRSMAVDQVNTVAEKFKRDGYNVQSSFDPSTGGWRDIKKEFEPHVVFFTVPYSYTAREYHITHFDNSLTLYVPYAFVVIPRLDLHYDGVFYSCLWRFCLESPYHQEYAKSFGQVNNVRVTGYPGLDVLRPENTAKSEAWKETASNAAKKVIWAPHHSIAGQDAGLGYSSFLLYSDFFFQLIDKFEGQLQMAFKPHPLLKDKLYNDQNWGKEKTDAYFDKWRTHELGQLEEGEYTDLFLTSDALLHDSASFMAEYLVTEKPLMFLVPEEGEMPKFNSFGDLLFEQHYKGATAAQIESFISETVFESKDNRLSSRQLFIKNHIQQAGNHTAGENIINEINKLMGKDHE